MLTSNRGQFSETGSDAEGICEWDGNFESTGIEAKADKTGDRPVRFPIFWWLVGLELTSRRFRIEMNRHKHAHQTRLVVPPLILPSVDGHPEIECTGESS